MIVDVRTYRVRPNKMPQELDLHEKHGLAPQVRHLDPPLAYLYGESGDINTLRGGEYCFMPGLRALRWLATLGSSSA